MSGIGGPGTGLVYFPGSVAGAAARYWTPVRRMLPPLALALNGIGAVLEAVFGPLARRWPASLILVARRSGN